MRRPSHRSVTVAVCLAAAALLAPMGAVAQDTPRMRARSVLPPGNAQTYTVDGVVAGNASGNPDDYGSHVDDQRELYWNYEYKDGALRPEPFCDDPQTPIDGVTICFDEYGVPAVYADETRDLWYGVGYAVAQVRLFLLDAVRRTARGTLAELSGPAAVPADVATRTLTYTEEEYEQQIASQPQEAREAVSGFVDGVNAWIGEVTTTAIDQLPAEYVLLQTVPEPITATDVAAAGVLMTRDVASAGGFEMDNVAALRTLEEVHGTAQGRRIFRDLLWEEDRRASVTVPRNEGVFARTDRSPAQRDAAFEAMADFAATVPLDLATGQGTGDHPEPDPAPGAGLPAAAPSGLAASLQATGIPNPGAQAAAALEEFRRSIDGGSFLVAIAPEKTADGSALVVSEPQLDLVPQLLVEIEVHGAGYHARGTTVPGLPVVGIGYNDVLGWAVTTGNSKTVDSFIETTRPDSDGDGAPEYLHDGEWKNQECRTESVAYRATDPAAGVPIGPAVFSEDVQVCRTVHGPVVATTDDGAAARSVQYAMWQREVDTIQGVLAWSRARDLDDFQAAMRKVTWNENTGYADADGNIAYWHPGLHHVRDPGTDMRLPIPGTGEYDHGGFLAFEDLPHVVNPDQGWVANWNNKPAHGWGDHGGLGASSYPAGRGHRVRNLFEILDARDDWTFDALVELDRFAGSHDTRAREFLPLILALGDRDDLTTVERRALDALADWDRSANGVGADMQPLPSEYTDADFTNGTQATVGAAPTVFNATVEALLSEVLAPLRDEVPDFLAELGNKGRHVYDMGPLENYVLRTLEPSASSISRPTVGLRGRTPTQVVRAAFATAVDDLARAQGDDVSIWRSDYLRMEEVCSATGVVGPCGAMPFLERGAWIHQVGFAGAGTPAPGTGRPTAPVPPPVPDGDRLPATGGGVALLGLTAMGAARMLRRRTPTP